MASSVEVKFDEICRICMGCTQEFNLTADKTFLLHSVFDEVIVDEKENEKVQICDILHFSVNQLPKIDKRDELPLNICTRCLEKLLACYEFQHACINSDLRLRNLIQTVQTPQSSMQLASDIDSIQSFVKEEMIFQDAEINDNIEATNEMLENYTEEIELQTKVELCENNYVTSKMQEDLIGRNPDLEIYKTVWKCKVCSQCFVNKKLLILHIDDNRSNCKANSENQSRKQIINSTESISDIQACKNSLMMLNDPKQTTTEFDAMNFSKNYYDSWKCKICENTFSHKGNLRRHVRGVHNKIQAEDISSEMELVQCKNIDLPTKCDECDQVFQSLRLFNLHKENHANPLPSNSRCGQEEFQSMSSFEQHRDLHSQEQLLTGQFPRHPTSLPSSKLDEAMSQCEPRAMCEKSLDRPEQHKQFFICSRCGAKFGDINSLREHAQLHDSEKSYDCCFCEKKFRTYSAVYSHKRRTHKDLN